MAWEIYHHEGAGLRQTLQVRVAPGGKAHMSAEMRRIGGKYGGHFDLYVNAEDGIVGMRLFKGGSYKIPTSNGMNAALGGAIRKANGGRMPPVDTRFAVLERDHTGSPFLIFSVKGAGSPEKKRG